MVTSDPQPLISTQITDVRRKCSLTTTTTTTTPVLTLLNTVFSWYGPIRHNCCVRDRSAVVFAQLRTECVADGMRLHGLPDTTMSQGEVGRTALPTSGTVVGNSGYAQQLFRSETVVRQCRIVWSCIERLMKNYPVDSLQCSP